MTHLTHIPQRQNIAVIEVRQHARLALKTRGKARPIALADIDDFDGNGTPQPQVLAAIHRTHAAASQQPLKNIGSNPLPNQCACASHSCHLLYSRCVCPAPFRLTLPVSLSKKLVARCRAEMFLHTVYQRRGILPMLY